MPELPEVETTRRLLEPALKGKVLSQLWSDNPHKYLNLSLAEGKKVLAVSRRGKYLILELTNDLEVVVHLGMTGGFLFEEGRHTRVRLEAGKRKIFFNDPRRFGFWRVVDKGDYSGMALLRNIGPEPLSDDFHLKLFAEVLAKKSRKIKEVLLEQHAVAGVGNIYADESLWVAKIHPAMPSNQLSKAQSKRLFEAIKHVMHRAVEAGGSTLSDKTYQQPSGKPGYFQLEHNVYDRKGKPCNRCGGEIQKIVLAARGTHFCPKCQAAPQ